MWPSWRKEHQRIIRVLQQHNNTRQPLPGLSDSKSLETLAWQIVASLRRQAYYHLVQKKKVFSRRADPNRSHFDAERAVAYFVQTNQLEEAAWLIFLMTHFAKPEESGWLRLKDVYGKLGTGRWTWKEVKSDPSDFQRWLAQNWQQIRGKFGNHRKYESLRPSSNRDTSSVVASYLSWVGPQGQIAHFNKLVRTLGNDPHTIFDGFYHDLKVKSFGRLAKFDFLSLLGRYQVVPMDAGSAYLSGATGPLAGVRLLFDGKRDGNSSIDQLQTRLDLLDKDLKVSMKVLEDALCNWQKSPKKFVHFKG